VTWSNAPLPSGTPPLDAVSCADSSHCVGVGRGVIAATSDGGSDWALSALPVANTTLVGADCSTTSLCLAAGLSNNRSGYSGVILRSTDHGSTWQSASVPPGTQGMTAVICPSSTDCIAIGASLLVSTDGGATWFPTTVPGGVGELRSISCSTATQCVAIGPNPAGLTNHNAPGNAIKTTDGGATWTALTLPNGTATLDQISCSGGSSCVAGGLNPSTSGAAPFYESTDGGSSWASAPSSPSGMSEIAGVSCPAADHCAVVGRQSTLQAATATTSDLTTWQISLLPGNAVPPPTDAPS
jgi:photosystem II stability/assembly factor-like uncharacterized protein